MSERVPQHVLITGAEGFLGTEAVTALMSKGARVTASCFSEEGAERLRGTLGDARGGAVRILTCDLGDHEQVKHMISAAWSVGPVEGLLHAAGGFRYGEIAACGVEDFDFLMSANVKGPFLVARELTPLMRKARYGRLVFVSARATQAPATAGMGPYSASKAALNALIQSLADELKGSNVTANAVMPTVIDTPANRKAMPDADPTKWVKPATLVDVAWGLMSEPHGALTGGLFPVPGLL